MFMIVCFLKKKKKKIFLCGKGDNSNLNIDTEISNLYRGPSIDASYQVSVHLAKRFQRRRFKKIGRSEKRIACDGHVCKWIGTK
jgi:hypothetical protein